MERVAMEPRIMLKMSVRELRDALKTTQTALIPLGVCEQHGYHLPLGADVHNAEQVCRRVAERFPAIVAPTMTYSFSGGMLPGTINVSPAVVSLLLTEAVLSLYTQGFRRICIVMGHGGSELNAIVRDSLRIFLWENPDREELQLALFPFWEFSPTLMGMVEARDYHAAAAETSLMLYWAPQEVRDEVVLDDPEVAEMLREDPDFYQEQRVKSDSPYEIPHTRQKEEVKVGVMGFPEQASREMGEKICEESVSGIVRELQVMEDQKDSGYRLRAMDKELKILRARKRR